MKAKILFSLSLLIAVFAFYSCDDDDDAPVTPTITNFTGTLSGDNEVPPNDSEASGTVNFTYNPATKRLSGTVTYTGLTVTGAHIHKGAAGQPGGVVFPLGSAPFTSPISFTSPALTTAQENDLMNGLYFVNLHSANFPDGEIRVQLVKSTSGNQIQNYTATLNGANQSPANSSTATGNGTFTYNPQTKILSGNLTYSGITPTAIYIQNGAAAGDTIFSLGKAPFTSPVSFTSQALTAAQISDLESGKYYLNIRSTAYPNGEIRGMLSKQSSGTGTGY